MEVKRLRNLVLEVFKTNNNSNPEYMKVNQNNTTKYGIKCLCTLEPHIWNNLLKHIKIEII